jgi:hypothetical protein
MSKADDYAARVRQAYRELALQYQTPDVSIHALHGKLGGSIRPLHQYLQSACVAHTAVPSTGEPTAAGQAALQSALRLPGEKESFLLIRLLEPQPAMNPEPNLNQKTATASIEQLVFTCERFGRDFSSKDAAERFNDACRELKRHDPAAFAEWQQSDVYSPRRFYLPERSPEQQACRYEALLRETAELRYPKGERTLELEARIEKTVQKKVQAFTQERQAKVYEQSLRRQLAEKKPNLTPDEAKHYERRINELVDNFRKNQAQQQAQTAPAHSHPQEQSRGM